MNNLNKNLVTILILFVFSGLIIYFLIIPKYKLTSELSANFQKTEEDLSKQESVVMDIDKLFREYQKLDQNKTKNLFFILPSSLNFPQILIQLEALTSGNGLILQDVSLSQDIAPAQNSAEEKKKEEAKKSADTKDTKETAKPADFRSANLTINLIGSYESLKSFLKSLEKNIRIFDIVSLNFTPPTEFKNGIIPPFNFNLILRIYYK